MLFAGFVDTKSTILIIVFGLIGFFAPAFSIIIATFPGPQDIAMWNSTMLMVLSLLVIVFLVIKTFGFYFSTHKKLFIVTLILLILSVISFVMNLNTFMAL